MKLKFKNQDFQTDAVNAVTDLFIGQSKGSSTFSIVEEQQINILQNEFGVGNVMLIDSDTLKANMNAIQRRNKLSLSSDLESRQFCIEMETGVKFGILQLSLFVGQTYEEKKIVEKTISTEQATQVLKLFKQMALLMRVERCNQKRKTNKLSCHNYPMPLKTLLQR